jgi:hypothetical protein
MTERGLKEFQHAYKKVNVVAKRIGWKAFCKSTKKCPRDTQASQNS